MVVEVKGKVKTMLAERKGKKRTKFDLVEVVKSIWDILYAMTQVLYRNHRKAFQRLCLSPSRWPDGLDSWCQKPNRGPRASALKGWRHARSKSTLRMVINQTKMFVYLRKKICEDGRAQEEIYHQV